MLIFHYAPAQTPTQFLYSKIKAGRNHQEHLIFTPSPLLTNPQGRQACLTMNYTLSIKQGRQTEHSVTQHQLSWLLDVINGSFSA